MNTNYLTIILLILMIRDSQSNCGCLNCNSKYLRVVSPPHLPYRLIYRGAPFTQKLYSYSIQKPQIRPTPPLNTYDYTVEAWRPLDNTYYDEPPPSDQLTYQVQMPEVRPKVFMEDLVAQSDRMVMSEPDDIFQ